ncbi:PilZ domain-containing protein [Sphingomonas sp. BN140010]|uniref:PilZ domain-containing protein n=1 Tax=Sphingomonas arvum TaxID=2992113 RepID=A0ABT3JGH4_9SPHN|nr:PilZ domain-containing protein [Sphingomonas sp. BN140010]MCW3798186.1 PilZ domain-containing protein [Sphingomonas sp. BN140010]
MDPTSILERRPRHAVRLTATVRVADGACLRAPVSDLSLNGCCLGIELPIGEGLELELPELEKLRGQVRWSVNGRSGIRFAAA